MRAEHMNFPDNVYEQLQIKSIKVTVGTEDCVINVPMSVKSLCLNFYWNYDVQFLGNKNVQKLKMILNQERKIKMFRIL